MEEDVAKDSQGENVNGGCGERQPRRGCKWRMWERQLRKEVNRGCSRRQPQRGNVIGYVAKHSQGEEMYWCERRNTTKAGRGNKGCD